jgi:hypothetical protein
VVCSRASLPPPEATRLHLPLDAGPMHLGTCPTTCFRVGWSRLRSSALASASRYTDIPRQFTSLDQYAFVMLYIAHYPTPIPPSLFPYATGRSNITWPSTTHRQGRAQLPDHARSQLGVLYSITMEGQGWHPRQVLAGFSHGVSTAYHRGTSSASPPTGSVSSL